LRKKKARNKIRERNARRYTPPIPKTKEEKEKINYN
jgi:hypothetical protein